MSLATNDMKRELSLEQQFIVDYSKNTLSAVEIEGLEKYRNCLDWDKIFKLARNHKVTNLLFSNIKKYCPNTLYNEFDAQQYELIKYQNEQRNNFVYLQFDLLINQLNEAGIKVCPVKGVYLIDNVYKDRSIRQMNDMDLLFLKKDKKAIESIFAQNGFTYGFFENGEVVPLDIELRNVWKLKSYNLPPFVKPLQNEYAPFIKLDLSFALDFSLDTSPVEEMIGDASFNGRFYQLKPEHYFIHLCTHLYREASNAPWLKTNKDLLICKFTDIREFLISQMDSDSIDKAIAFAKKHNIEKAIYYSVYYMDLIFNESWGSKIFSKLSIEDESFLQSYTSSDFSEARIRKKSFWESLFAQSNMDELE